MRDKTIIINTHNDNVYHAFNRLHYNNEINIPISSERDKMAVQRIIENINRKGFNVQTEHIHYYKVKKINPINFNIYKKENRRKLI
jgi:hypothetical protein